MKIFDDGILTVVTISHLINQVINIHELFLAKFRRPRKNKMTGELSDHCPEVKEEKKPIVDKIPFDSVCAKMWTVLLFFRG